MKKKIFKAFINGIIWGIIAYRLADIISIFKYKTEWNININYMSLCHLVISFMSAAIFGFIVSKKWTQRIGLMIISFVISFITFLLNTLIVMYLFSYSMRDFM